MCFITFNKGYVVFPSPEIKFLPINIFLGIYDFFFCEIFEPQRVKHAEKDDDVIETLKSENVVLKKRLVSLEDCVEELIALSRGSDLIISGNEVPLFTSGENCKDIMTDLIKNGLNCTMDSSGILEAHNVFHSKKQYTS